MMNTLQPGYSVRSQTLLLSMMAKQRVTVSYSPSVSTATYSTQSRHFVLPLYQGVSGNILDAFALHELLHLMYTKRIDGVFDPIILLTSSNEIIEKIRERFPDKDYFTQYCYPLLSSMAKDTINIFEDVRIERLGCEDPNYKGISSLLYMGYRELWDGDIGGWRSKMIATLADTVSLDNPLAIASRQLAQLNFYAKFGHRGISTATHNSSVLALHKKAMACETYEDVVQLVEDFWFDAFLLAYEESKKITKKVHVEIVEDTSTSDEMDEIVFPKFDEKEEKSEEIGENSPKIEEKEEKSEEIEKDALDEEEMFYVNTPEKKEEFSTPKDTPPLKQEEIDSLLDLLDRSGTFFVRALSSAQRKSGKGLIRISCPNEIPKEKILTYQGAARIWERFWNDVEKTPEQIKAYKDDLWETYYKGSHGRVAQLVSEFMCKKSANNFAKGFVSKTGRLDPRKLSMYRSRDDIFLRNFIVPEGKSHGSIILIDWSCSMDDKIGKTIVRMLDYVWFCRRMGIPHRVFSFSNNKYLNSIEFQGVIEDGTDEHHDLYTQRLAEETSQIRMDDLVLGEFFNLEMSESEFMEMAKNLLHFAMRHELKDDPEYKFRDKMWNVHGTQYVDYPHGMALGQTPLRQAMITAIPALHEMKAKYGTEKNTLFILTDGDDTEGLPTSHLMEQNDAERNNFELEDPRSGHSVVSYAYGRSCSSLKTFIGLSTAQLSKFIQESTGSATICMHVIPGRKVFQGRRSKRTTKELATAMNTDIGDADTIAKMVAEAFDSLRTYGHYVCTAQTSWTSYIYVPSSEVAAVKKWEENIQAKMSKNALVKKIQEGLLIKESGAIIARTIVESMNKTILDAGQLALD